MVAGLFGSSGGSSSNTGTANELLSAARQTDIVSTAPPVKEYRNVSKGEADKAKQEAIKEMQESLGRAAQAARQAINQKPRRTAKA